MAGVTISMDSREISAALDRLEALAADTSPLLAEIGEIALSQAQDSFQEQAGPDGSAWQPSLRALAQGGQTLIDSGQLLASLSLEVLPDSVVVGSNKVYAAIHQFGGQAGRGGKVRLPARPYLPDESTVDMDEITRAIEAHFADVIH